MKKLLVCLCFFSIWISGKAQVDFQAAQSSILGSRINTVTIGDVNNDGLDDAIVATTFYFDPDFDYHIFVFLQNPDGTISEPSMYPYPETYGSNTTLQAADVNNDGLIDIIIGYDDYMGVYFQNPSGLLDPVVSFYSGFDVDGIAIGDLNNDKLDDIAVCHWNQDYIKVFYQSTDNNFTTGSYGVESGGWDEIDVGDMNNDNLDDIIFMPGTSSEGTLIIFYQDSIEGITQNPTVLNYSIDSHNRFNGFGIGDLNNNGKNDIVGSIGGNIAWIALIYQDENGNMGEASYIPSYDIPTPVEIGDLNCDGKNEIVVGHSAWSRFSVFEQDSLGNYDDYTLFGSLYYVTPYGLALGDLNDDSRLDVLTTNGSIRTYFVYNRSAPDNLLYSDTIVTYTNYEIDTISTFSYTFTCNKLDTVDQCLVQTTQECTETTSHIYYNLDGDSAIYREYEICGNFFEDTIHIEIDIAGSITEIDTAIVILSVDTIFEDYIITGQYSLYDTLDMYTEHAADTVVIEDINFINDTLYIIIDSLFVQSHLLLIDYEESYFEILEGIYCGEFITDTLLAWIERDTNIIILESDTTLISHTIALYPYGINSLQAKNKVKIFPNPASGYFQIECSFPFSLELYSLGGELLIESGDRVINISQLPEASYIIAIKNLKGHLITTQKFIKK